MAYCQGAFSEQHVGALRICCGEMLIFKTSKATLLVRATVPRIISSLQYFGCFDGMIYLIRFKEHQMTVSSTIEPIIQARQNQRTFILASNTMNILYYYEYFVFSTFMFPFGERHENVLSLRMIEGIQKHIKATLTTIITLVVTSEIFDLDCLPKVW